MRGCSVQPWRGRASPAPCSRPPREPVLLLRSGRRKRSELVGANAQVLVGSVGRQCLGFRSASVGVHNPFRMLVQG